ncbi:LysE family translocator [Paraburkholderia caballeronis]|uniref:LysE family translocator n=1 Tax=Paraburkholderia caballeronis TaxID=416943 RepID=UPI00106621CA|nr:LysE family translocator [Paraburkholderia caballeronis]TDV06769.1 threonine/homoserine/homoserine lactone efflux protein [Paraburkholderia caballeronis]TDV09949.1 threonine/homoserine/homoserine lactone efflux protein [Paraburkholderia caballeronis]TDV21781.1 threonine/homoserine/homoserine lactone efflux protein [Paraburkholderia caballeronis]
MSASASIAGILAALLLGAMSPGPSFVMVARNAIGLSRGDGIATALGMGVGGIFFGGIALAGLYTLLASVAWLYVALKVAGGAYLVYLAVRIWRGAAEPIAFDRAGGTGRRSLSRSFWLGLTTQLSNPKTAVVYGSIFVALLPQHPPVWCYVALPPLVFAIEAGWYTVVAWCFSGQRPRDMYLRAKKWIDRAASGVIAALGLRLILVANRNTL